MAVGVVVVMAVTVTMVYRRNGRRRSRRCMAVAMSPMAM